MSVHPHREPSSSQWPDPTLPRRPARILWLRRHGPTEIAIDYQLLVTFQQIGARLERGDVFSLSGTQLAEADLILMDAFEQIEGVVETLVSRVRIESRAPLVILTRKHSHEQLIMALQAGADAIWSLESSPLVLRAHCQALLRRWPRPPSP